MQKQDTNLAIRAANRRRLNNDVPSIDVASFQPYLHRLPGSDWKRQNAVIVTERPLQLLAHDRY
jgi:hypothetical protein